MDAISWPTLILVSDWAIRIGLAVRIVMRRAAVPVSLAWLVVVLLMPFLGLVAYLLVGETRLGRSRLRTSRSLSRDIEREALAIWQHHHLEWTTEDEMYRHLARIGAAVSGLPPLRGNAVELIADTHAFLDRLIADLDAATSHCHLLFFIWMDGGRGVEVAEAVARAARRGVQCRVLVDAVGSKPFLRGRHAAMLREAGAQVVPALPVSPLRMLFSRIDLRNHRKIAVIDGRIGYTGSQNIADDTFKLNREKRIGPWIDTMVRIQGPATQALQAIFLSDWLLDAPECFASLETFFPPLPVSAAGGGGTGHVVHVLPSGPGAQPEGIHESLLATLYAARFEIVVTTPYFMPDEATKAALRVAAMRGVDVTVVVPEVLDAPVVAAASKAQYGDLLDAGVKILHYRDGLLHAKTVTVDTRLVLIGSANFDIRSFWLNFEITLFIYDDDFASLVRFMQTSYMDRSRPVSRDAWLRRPAWVRFRENAAQLLGPLL